MILLYHHVAPQNIIPDTHEPNEGWHFTHSPKGFERHLIELKKRGYSFISLQELTNEILKHGTEPHKTVAITFDDGWIDNYVYAFPILKAYSIPATFFCTTGHIHKSEPQTKKMNVAQLLELLAANMSIGGHTRTHPNLTALPIDRAREEIAGCKADLERALGTGISLFAYPGGAFNHSVLKITQESGYTSACSVLGPAPNNRSSLFWLYRDVLSNSMNTLRDLYRLSNPARNLLRFRTHQKLLKQLAQPYK